MLARVLMQLRANRLIASFSRGTVRENSDTADQLRKIGDPAVGPLIRALSDPDRVTHIEAVRTLGHLGSVEALRPLTAVTKDDDPEFANEALKAIRRILARNDRRHPDSPESIQ